MESFCGSPLWSTNLTWDTPNPRFTPCFERTVLIWGPCIFLWFFSLFEIINIRKLKVINIPWNWLDISKFAIIIFLILLTTIELSVTIHKSSKFSMPDVEYYTPLIKIATFILTLTILKCKRKHGLKVSGLLFLFWFSLMIFAIPQLRSQIIDQINPNVENENIYFLISSIIYFLSIIVIFILNCFAEHLPSNYGKSKNPSPEHQVGFLQILFYTWVDPLMFLGYKRTLVFDDLWSLNSENRSIEVFTRFNRFWQKSLEKFQKKKTLKTEKKHRDSKPLKNVSILPSIIKTFGKEYIFLSLFRLIDVIFEFVSPILLGALITFVEIDDYLWKGYLYASGLLIFGIVATLLLAQYNMRIELIGLRIYTALTSAIYRKSLCLSNLARQQFTTGEIVNLISVDAARFLDIFFYLNYIWSAPITLSIAFYFLWQILGPSCLAGLAVMILLTPLNTIVTKKAEKFQSKQMKYMDMRVKIMNEILNSIKVLKLYGWESSFELLVSNIRNKELSAIKYFLHMRVIMNLFWVFAPFMVTIVSFTFFVLSDPNNVLDSKTAFVSISLFNIMRFPLSMIPHMILAAIETFVSIKRINNFMNADELDENNVGHDLSKENPLIIENGTFSWEQSEPVLKDININIPSGSLVAIVGHIGAGKSSLISAFLGEINKLSGIVNTLGTISYVSQKAWIQNCTLQNNILFGKTLNNEIYQSVINACALKPDLDILPGGDQTEIGEKGINLSGGQKQRVSFARAVYCDSDIYFFDDPLSAVDSHVGKHIFDQAIGPHGLLKGKTRILVTHSIAHLPQVDYIIVMKEGKVSECGSYQQLLSNKASFADFLLQHLTNLNQEETDVNEIKLQLEQSLGSSTFKEKFQRVRSLSESESEAEQKLNGLAIEEDKTLENDMVLNEKLNKYRLIDSEKLETGTVKWQIYLYYLLSFGLLFVLGTILSNVIFQAFTIGSNVWLSIWSSDDSLNNNNTNSQALDLYLGVYGILGLGLVTSAFFFELIPNLGCLAAAKLMHEVLLNGILKSPMTFFDTTPIGRILSRFSKDINILNSSIPTDLGSAIHSTIQVAASLLVICFTTPLFISVIIPIGFMYYFIQRFFIASSRQLKRLESAARSPIYSHFGESISGASTIRAYQVQERFINESEKKVDDLQVCYYPMIISNIWLAIRLETVGNIIIFFSALFAVISKDSISPGLVGLSVSYALQITDILNWLVERLSELETDMVSVERLKEFSEINQEAPWEIPSTTPQPDWPTKGHIEIENLVMRYHSDTEPVLHNISCEIKSGEKIGIVGRTGAGKSTLTLALFRIHEATEGKIMIDGIDIATLGLHSLRSRLTIIPQDPVLFSGSLRMNLDPFNQFSDIEVWHAIEQAHLHEFVKGLVAGLNHEISEGGENISVGQRQLVCLARALLRKTQILILDEATAAVDLDMDDLIQNTIRKEFASCTILTIAHRLNTIMDSNRVLVLDKGMIVEFDSPSNLLLNKVSLFYDMAKAAGIVN